MTPMPEIVVNGGAHIGRATLDTGRLTAIGRAVAGRDDLLLRSVTYTAGGLPHAGPSPPKALLRARLELAARTVCRFEARLFVKELRSPEHWPMLDLIPQ